MRAHGKEEKDRGGPTGLPLERRGGGSQDSAPAGEKEEQKEEARERRSEASGERGGDNTLFHTFKARGICAGNFARDT